MDEFREIVRAQYPHIEIVPINAHTGQPMVADPPPDSTSFEVVRDIGRRGPLKTESFLPAAGEEPVRGEEGLPGFVGASPSVQRLCAMARLVAQRDTTVLITGESGTGKDLVAQAVHRLSLRRLKPFVVINCAAIPEPLLEAELFGFVKGAFTGAVQSRIGRIHAAQGGTLFLDEIGDLPLGLQSKLLRFLEQGEVQRLGSSDTFRVDVRVVAATNALVGDANEARKNGIVSLDAKLDKIKDPFLKKSLMLAVDGTEPQELRKMMELELDNRAEHEEKIPQVFESAGGFAPTIGIIGAVLGLIQVMQHLENIDEVGKGIAVAFVATIYGVGSANLLFLPSAGKMKIRIREEQILREMAVEGVVSILEGMNPRMLETRLLGFLSDQSPRAQKQAKLA